MKGSYGYWVLLGERNKWACLFVVNVIAILIVMMDVKNAKITLLVLFVQSVWMGWKLNHRDGLKNELRRSANS